MQVYLHVPDMLYPSGSIPVCSGRPGLTVRLVRFRRRFLGHHVFASKGLVALMSRPLTNLL